MPAKSVAVEGDVKATVGTMPFTGAQSGTWTAGSISYTSYANLKSGGKKVIWKATCLFSFKGASASGATVTGTETVTVTATTKLLNKGQRSVLVDGDTRTGGDLPAPTPNYDNKLTVSASGPLKTT
jgi:hypothetical protein